MSSRFEEFFFLPSLFVLDWHGGMTIRRPEREKRLKKTTDIVRSRGITPDDQKLEWVVPDGGIIGERWLTNLLVGEKWK